MVVGSGPSKGVAGSAAAFSGVAGEIWSAAVAGSFVVVASTFVMGFVLLR
jgi:hypothetical protein